MKKSIVAALLAVFALVCPAGIRTTSVAAEEPEAVRTESLALSDVLFWDTQSNRDIAVFDLNFSRDCFMKADMSTVDFRIIDGAMYPDEDFSYIQDYILFNGESIKTINETTDVTDYEFITFPSDIGAPFNVPVIIYSSSKSKLQVRVHKDWLESKELYGKGLKVTLKSGLYTDAKTTNEDLSAYVPVRYELKKDITVTYDGEKWTSDTPYENYVRSEEIINRKDIDFSKINYEKITVTGLSRFVGYGDFRTVGDQSVQNTFFQIYFDKPLFYQTVDYASASKANMKTLCKNTMTDAQIDAWFDYRLDLAFANCIVINGKTLGEIKKEAQTDLDVKLFAQYSSNLYALTIYVEALEDFHINPAQDYTVTIKKGFRTPLFGEVKEDQTFYYNTVSQTWSSSVGGEIPDYGTETDKVVGYTVSKGCSSSYLGSIALLPLIAAGAYFVVRRKDHE